MTGFPAPGQAAIFRAPFPGEQGDSRALLLRAAGRYAHCSSEQLGPIAAGPWGKPFFPQAPQIQFSLTHSGDWWLCAFSSHPLGLDLQVHRSHTPPAQLSQRFFHPDEDAFLARGGYRDFFDLWCAKESWVKYTGRGFFDDPADFSVVSRNGEFPARENAWLQMLPFAPQYSLCLCTEQPLTAKFQSL